MKEEIVFELNVPSGIMVAGNDFRPHFDFLGDYNINEIGERIKTTKAMEKIGCAHAFVGNSCPGVYKTGENTFIIAAHGYDEETDENINPEGIEVANTGGDISWYSIVDKDEFIRRGCEGVYSYNEIVVNPGVYRFTHNLAFNDEYDKATIYTEIEWIRPPDPVKDYQKEWLEKNFTAGQIIYNSILRSPTLYGSNAVQRVANCIFCLENGDDWHENGFVQYDPDMLSNAPEIKIPDFDKLYYWSSMLFEDRAICKAAGIGKKIINLNPSFLALARNVLKCIIKYGSRGYPKNQEIAQKCLEGLNKRYPLTT